METSVISFYQETSILIVAGVEPPSCVEWNLTLIYFVGCQCVIPIWSFVMKAFFWPTLETSCFVRKAWPRAFACCSNFTHTHITHIFEGRVYLMDAPWYSFFFSEAVCVQFSQGSVYHFGNPHAIEMNFVGALLALFSTSLAVPSIRDDTTSLSPEAECLSWNETHFILSCFAKIQKYTKVL